jgi:O-antigen/teichoic acid export membrane protein
MRVIPAFILRRIEHRPNLLKIVDNIGWLFIDKILRMVVGLLVGVWIARYLGPDQYGLLSYALAFTGLFGAIATLGLQSIVVRDIVRNPDDARLTLGTAALLQLIGGLFAFVLALIVIARLRPEDTLMHSIVAMLGAMLLLKTSDIAVYWFESQVQSKYVIWVQNSVFLVFSIGKAALILSSAPLTAFVLLMVVEAVLVALILVIVFSKFGQSLSTLEFNGKRAKELLKDSWPLLISSMAIVIYMKIDQVMLGEIKGNEAVGIFAAASMISEVWYFIPMAIVASVSPTIISLKKKCRKEYIRRTQQLFDWLVLLSFIIAIPMTFLSDFFIKLLYGNLYTDAATILSIHIWATVFVSLGVASSPYLLAENRQIISMQRTFAGLITNILLNFILIPEYGAIGAAIATIISQAMATFIFDLLQNETRMLFKMKLKSIFLINFINFRGAG